MEGITVQRYGAYIFHTSDRAAWDHGNALADFNNSVNEPIANLHGEIYNMPFNVDTFSRPWGASAQAKAILCGPLQYRSLCF